MAANSLLLWSCRVSFLSHEIRLGTSPTVAFSGLSSRRRLGSPNQSVSLEQRKEKYLLFVSLSVVKNKEAEKPSVGSSTSPEPCDIALGLCSSHPTKLGAVTRTQSDQLNVVPWCVFISHRVNCAFRSNWFNQPDCGGSVTLFFSTNSIGDIENVIDTANHSIFRVRLWLQRSP